MSGTVAVMNTRLNDSEY